MEAVAALNRGPSGLLRQAMALEAEGRLVEAAELNERALTLDPKLAQAHINLISAYGRLKDYARAESHYRAAVALNPNLADAHYNFGVLCLETGRTREAWQAFERTLRADPGHANAESNLGSLLAARGQWDAAAERFRRALERQPDLRGTRFQLGRILANQRRYREAQEQFAEAAKVEDPATPSYLYALGATQARAGQPQLARQTLVRARDLAVRFGQTDVAAAIERDLARLRP